MRDIIGVGELGRKTVRGESLPMLTGQQHDSYVRQSRGEFINEFSGFRNTQHYASGMQPPETLRSLEWGTWLHPGDTEFAGNATGFRGLERIGNLPAEGAKPAKGNIPAFGRVTLDLLGGLGSVPAEGAKPAKGAVPAFGFLQGVRDFFGKKKGEHGAISGLGFGNLGTIPARGDTRGHTASDFVKILGGHADTLKSGQEKEFDMRFAHGGDSFKVGSDLYPTSWYVVKSSAPTTGSQSGQWKRDFERPYTLKPGEYQSFTNDENKLKDTDVDMYVTLMTVGESAEETSTAQQKSADAEKAIENAQAAAAAAKSDGIDTTAMEKTIAKAQDSLSKNDYTAATSAANSAAKDALDAKTLKDKQDLERQKTDINNDTTLSADQKANMKAAIDQQKAALDANNQNQKDQLPKTGIKLDWKIAAIAGVGIAAVAGIAIAMRKKK